MKRELMNWEKIFANNVIHEGIISKIKKAAHATQKAKNPIKKMSRKPIKTFLHRRHTRLRMKGTEATTLLTGV